MSQQRYLVTVALPYSNGRLHVGHIAVVKSVERLAMFHQGIEGPHYISRGDGLPIVPKLTSSIRT